MSMLYATDALLPGGWAQDVMLAWEEDGTLLRVEPGSTAPTGVPRAPGVLLPGMPNLHSHAFQRAFAGLTEYRAAAQDSFWTWRDLMYRFALRLSPDDLEDIATLLYLEMLRCGYTSVCEFHYVHHDQAGRPYANPAEMSLRLARAARRAGIGLTMLPVLYQHSGFGASAAREDQRRFVLDVDGLMRIVEALRAQGVRTGVAPHSLRAVGPAALAELLDAMQRVDATAPVHIHVAEQLQEVRDCEAWCGQRPVQWLLDHAPVDARWCLVHATHLDDRERAGALSRDAVIGLCPTTEANLGDGIFDAPAWHGVWGIGSDSHASVDAAEELRLLEYTQRLARLQRNVLADAALPGVAESLWLSAVAGGAQATGRPVAGLVAGQQADFVVLADAVLDGLTPAQQLATHVFASHRRASIREVWVGGRCRVQNGQHAGAEAAAERFVAARGRLLSELG
ncbi:formimidoylglutamate deiminase [uncultured Piscinibacter sp.]|uniref:formimidoylglutamate deiminase n=1 Tax=uncultured Piscinibacter sp. TaxID=1131835 RepID=UPI00262BA0BD|nr:formimidoylglutamate deiminase [uncultured Piscinibacter sp.]